MLPPPVQMGVYPNLDGTYARKVKKREAEGRSLCVLGAHAESDPLVEAASMPLGMGANGRREAGIFIPGGNNLRADCVVPVAIGLMPDDEERAVAGAGRSGSQHWPLPVGACQTGFAC